MILDKCSKCGVPYDNNVVNNVEVGKGKAWCVKCPDNVLEKGAELLVRKLFKNDNGTMCFKFNGRVIGIHDVCVGELVVYTKDVVNVDYYFIGYGKNQNDIDCSESPFFGRSTKAKSAVMHRYAKFLRSDLIEEQG